MILMALNETALCFLSDTTTGTVATRRAGRSGSGSSKRSLQYKWSVSWTCSVDSREYSGSAALCGSATRANYRNTVYYYPFAPQISSLTAGRMAGFGSLLTAGAGVLLIFVINNPHKKRQPRPKRDFKAKLNNSVEEFYDERSKKS